MTSSRIITAILATFFVVSAAQAAEVRHVPLRNSSITTIASDQNNVYFGTKNGLFVLPDRAQADSYMRDDLRTYISEIVVLSEEELGVGTSQGFAVVRLNRDPEWFYLTSEVEAQMVADLLEFENQLYIGGSFGLYARSREGEYSLTSLPRQFSVVTAMAEGDGDILLSSGQEVILYSPSTNDWSPFIGQVSFDQLARISGDRWAALTRRGELEIISRSSPDIPLPVILPGDEIVTSFLVQPSQPVPTIWIGTQSGRLWRVSSTDDAIDNVSSIQPVAMPGEPITALHLRDNSLWVGHDDKGARRYEISPDGVTEMLWLIPEGMALPPSATTSEAVAESEDKPRWRVFIDEWTSTDLAPSGGKLAALAAVVIAFVIFLILILSRLMGGSAGRIIQKKRALTSSGKAPPKDQLSPNVRNLAEKMDELTSDINMTSLRVAEGDLNNLSEKKNEITNDFILVESEMQDELARTVEERQTKAMRLNTLREKLRAGDTSVERDELAGLEEEIRQKEIDELYLRYVLEE